MLVVDSVVPGGPAAGALEPGDVLVRVDGRVVTHFLPLEEALDDAVGGHVTLDVERGGQALQRRLAVADLHAVTPAAMLQVSGAVLHSLSYQQVCREKRAALQLKLEGHHGVELNNPPVA
jgi:C-terminal processing protease CtpA/Prc